MDVFPKEEASLTGAQESGRKVCVFRVSQGLTSHTPRVGDRSRK